MKIYEKAVIRRGYEGGKERLFLCCDEDLQIDLVDIWTCSTGVMSDFASDRELCAGIGDAFAADIAHALGVDCLKTEGTDYEVIVVSRLANGVIRVFCDTFSSTEPNLDIGLTAPAAKQLLESLLKQGFDVQRTVLLTRTHVLLERAAECKNALGASIDALRVSADEIYVDDEAVDRCVRHLHDAKMAWREIIHLCDAAVDLCNAHLKRTAETMSTAVLPRIGDGGSRTTADISPESDVGPLE